MLTGPGGQHLPQGHWASEAQVAGQLGGVQSYWAKAVFLRERNKKTRRTKLKKSKSFFINFIIKKTAENVNSY